jgi:hypothetical protein
VSEEQKKLTTYSVEKSPVHVTLAVVKDAWMEISLIYRFRHDGLRHAKLWGPPTKSHSSSPAGSRPAQTQTKVVL